MTDSYRELRNGQHLIKQAKASGWKEDDAEGPFNFIVRQAYELGQRDLQPEIDRLRSEVEELTKQRDEADAQANRAVEITERAGQAVSTLQLQVQLLLDAMKKEQKRGQDMHRRAQKAEGILRKMRFAHASSYYASIEKAASDTMTYGWMMLIANSSLFPRLARKLSYRDRRDAIEHFAKTGEIKLD